MLSELFNIDKFLGFCDKLWYFIKINVMFVISNIPVLLFCLFVGISHVREYLPLFLLCMIPAAPALSALMYSMNRLVQGIDSGAVKAYIKGYKRDFLQKVKLGIGQLLVIWVFWNNIEFFTLQVPLFPLVIIFIILFAAAVLVTPNLYLLISRYEMGNMQIVRTALTLMIVRPVSTLGSVAALGIVLAAFELLAGTAVLFMGSVYGFLIVFMNQRVLKQLEEMNQ